jgi:hypothetical protein
VFSVRSADETHHFLDAGYASTISRRAPRRPVPRQPACVCVLAEVSERFRCQCGVRLDRPRSGWISSPRGAAAARPRVKFVAIDDLFSALIPWAWRVVRVDHPPLPGWLQNLGPGALGLARDGVHGRLGRRVRGTADDDPLIRILHDCTMLSCC